MAVGEPGRLHDEVHLSFPVAPVVQAPRPPDPALAVAELREDEHLPDGPGRRRRPKCVHPETNARLIYELAGEANSCRIIFRRDQEV